MANSNERSEKKRPRITPLRVIGTIFKVIGTVLLVGALTCAILACFATLYIKNVIIPQAHLDVGQYSTDLTSAIYYTDKDTGQDVELVALHGVENRVWVSYDEIPEDLVNATIAIEDKQFWTHQGVNWKRTAYGVLCMFTGRDIQGGSTITQQLIKNLTQYDDVTVKRKVLEIFTALDFERSYEKSYIMEMYLNKIYLGEGCYGVATAARTYFDKELSELSLAECASLIAITNNPSVYSPYRYEGKYNKERQELILREMCRDGIISEAERDAAIAQPLVFARGQDEERPETIFSWYEEQVITDVVRDLVERNGLSEMAAKDLIYRGGVKIYACVDPEIQAIVEGVYENRDNLPLISAAGQQIESAVVVIDPDGNVVALAGAMGEKTGNRLWNYASDTVRQPGSSIKPLSVYAPALEYGLITPNSVVDDSPVRLNGSRAWPSNSYGYYYGQMTVHDAVKVSSNPTSVRVLQQVTPEASFEFMEDRFHFTSLESGRESWGRWVTDMDEAPLSVGGLTDGVSVLEMAAAYSVFPRGGEYVAPRTYTRVTYDDGTVILDNTQRDRERVLKETTAWYMTSMLRDVISGSGTGRTLLNNGGLSFYAAGKTGSTDSNNDRWFVGYSTYYTTAVWTGYRKPERIVYHGGYSNPAADMWKLVMQPIHEGLENRDFPQPSGLVSASYCMDSGMKPTEACSHDPRGSRVATGYFFSGDGPAAECDVHEDVEVCTACPILKSDGTESGLFRQAGEFCPKEPIGEVAATVETISLLNLDRPDIGKSARDSAYLKSTWDALGPCDVHTEEITLPPEYDPSTFNPADPATWPPAELYPDFDPANPETWPVPPVVDPVEPSDPTATPEPPGPPAPIVTPGVPEPPEPVPTPTPDPVPTPPDVPVPTPAPPDVPVSTPIPDPEPSGDPTGEPILPSDAGPDGSEPYVPAA